MYACTSDKYCPENDTFTSVEEFLNMCLAVFGSAPVLTSRNCGDHYEDESGAIVLRELEVAQ